MCKIAKLLKFNSHTVKSEYKGHAYKENPAPGDDSCLFGWPYSSYSQILSAVRESVYGKFRFKGHILVYF